MLARKEDLEEFELGESSHSVICFEVVDLFSEKDCPHVFAQKFDHVEVIGETGAVTGESGKWGG